MFELFDQSQKVAEPLKREDRDKPEDPDAADSRDMGNAASLVGSGMLSGGSKAKRIINDQTLSSVQKMSEVVE